MKPVARLILLVFWCASAFRANAQEQTTTIGGYGNAALRWTTTHSFIGGKDTAVSANPQANIDRFVLFFSHSFNEKISFRSEVEIEDTKIQGGDEPNDPGALKGEVSVEQMYLDFSMSKGFNPRAGLILVPVGIINEFHEPPTFNGNNRPAFDQEDGGIIPTTWRELGFGAFGEIADGWNYRGYLMASMLAENFSHAGGIGEGKQEGKLVNASNLAVTGRVEYTGTKGLKGGASFYFGGTSGDNPAFGTYGNGLFAVPLTVISADVQYNVSELYLRGVWGMSMVDADSINKAFHTDSTGKIVDGISKGMGGFYVEAAYNVMKLIDNNSSEQLLPFVRYENINLNSTLAANSAEDKALEKTVITAGLTYKPTYNLALKFDWQSYSNAAFSNSAEGASKVNTVSVGLGYMF